MDKEYINNLHRLPPSMIIKLFACHCKRFLRLKISPAEAVLFKYYLTLILLNSTCVKETRNEIVTQLPTGMRIISRKYPASDIDVFFGIWKQRQYQPLVEIVKYAQNSSDQLRIIDAGANVGYSAIFFKDNYPKANIVALEPDIENYGMLKRNIELNKCPGLNPLNIGLWKHEVFLRIHKDFRDGRDWAYYASESSGPTELKGLSVIDIMKKYSWDTIDILKIDIEGGERHIFDDEDGAGKFLSRTRYIAIEIHDEFNIRDKICNCLTRNDFEYFEAGELTIGRNKHLTKSSGKTPGPHITVIIPAYNRMKTLPRAIDSVVCQTYDNWELIVVDDRSTDGTKEIVMSYVEKDGRIRYVTNNHGQGPGGARNQGIELAKGEYVAFLDSDDEWVPFHLEDITKEFKNNNDIDWIFSDCDIVIDDKNIERLISKKRNELLDSFRLSRRGELLVLDNENCLTKAFKYRGGFACIAGIQGSVIRKNMFEKIRFDENIFVGEDVLLALEAIANRFRLAYIDKTHFKLHVHQGNISANNPKKTSQERVGIFRSIEKMYKTIPQRIELTQEQKRILHRALADLYFWQFGYRSYLQENDRQNAKEYFLKGLRLRPFNIFYWKTYFLKAVLKL